jgi:hypothetical protein
MFHLFGTDNDPLPGGVQELLDSHRFQYDSDNVPRCSHDLKVSQHESHTSWMDRGESQARLLRRLCRRGQSKYGIPGTRGSRGNK